MRLRETRIFGPIRPSLFPEVSLIHDIGRSSDTLRSRTIIERHRGMWRYYRSYLRPEAGVRRRAVDVLIWLGIQSRCALQLTTNGVRRMVGRGG